MSNYNTTLQSNNTDLQEILNIINELPQQTIPIPVISVNNSGLITATAGTKSASYQLAFQPAKTITPSSISQIAVSSGQYTGGNITIAGDTNLVADNIKIGVNIFGVTGNYEGSGGGGDASAEDGIIMGTASEYTNPRVTSIGNYTFYSYSNLIATNFPAATDIGSWAFARCSNLTTINFPAATTIGDSAFQSCSSLTVANFPAATTIGSSAFASCSNLNSINFPGITSIGQRAFQECFSVTTANFPAATDIGSGAFSFCTKLTSISFPAAINIYGYAFYATSITEANFPKATAINGYTFYNCDDLITASFPSASLIYNYAFRQCYNLKSLYLLGSSMCALSASYAFYSTPIGGYSTSARTYGSIYVPTSLLTSYKAATNWTYFSSRFVGI